VPNTELDNKLLKALQGVANKDLKDFYQVGLWNYCEGDTDKDGKETITYCSPRKANFWFNPIEVWDLKNVEADEIYTQEMKDGIDAYHKVAKWMFTAYLIAIILTAAEFVVGIFAIFSRWGSLVTTIVSTVSSPQYSCKVPRLIPKPDPNRVRHRRRWLLNRHLRRTRWRLPHRPRTLQHQVPPRRQDAGRRLARRRLLRRFGLLLAHQHLLLLRQIAP
jgi:hypothetical protein